ncbi:MAG: SGNH/GDSL hydrolase family protein [Gemmatimonadota bacterium]|nr:SGNH/GDSL hydrolase family protein [Gemmatimonadota bacterium]
MSHVVLLGDSIFDNAAYVAGGPDVVTQLRPLLPDGWSATLCAVDGAAAADVQRQLARVPRDATHLVVSAGGNDALGHVDILSRPARSAAEVLGILADAAGAFEARYRRALASVVARGLPVTVCTVYNGNLPDPLAQRLASTALTVFNDAIVRAAVDVCAAVIDLRLVCSEAADYANPIEPSVRGGAKIARAVARAVTERRTHGARTEVFAR